MARTMGTERQTRHCDLVAIAQHVLIHDSAISIDFAPDQMSLHSDTGIVGVHTHWTAFAFDCGGNTTEFTMESADRREVSSGERLSDGLHGGWEGTDGDPRSRGVGRLPVLGSRACFAIRQNADCDR